MELVWKMHRRIYRATGGRLGGSISGMRVLVLTTTGRKSGQERATPLMHFEDDGRYVVIASNAGEPRDPAWWLNLKANPEAQIQIGRDERRVRAGEADGAERERLWKRLIEINDDYAVYEERAGRRIPVVLLEPLDAA
jgi:deazaflavin-dependent oxidoreductase (nitroreductase family)